MDGFFNRVAAVIEQARTSVGRTADLTMCVAYFEIGRMIVEEEQGGQDRAQFGKGLLKKLSAYLNGRVGKGFSPSTLKNARKFYQIYAPAIGQTMFAQLEKENQNKRLSPENRPTSLKSQTLFAESYPFRLGWSHYLILMRIENADERRFYEIEAVNQHWTFRQLQRQYASSLYERLALSRNQDGVMRLANEGQTLKNPHDMLKNPLVLEFLGLDEKAEYTENDLETAIINKLQAFLLELGKGFLFEARQKRFTFGEDHFMVEYSDSQFIPIL